MNGYLFNVTVSSVNSKGFYYFLPFHLLKRKIYLKNLQINIIYIHDDGLHVKLKTFLILKQKKN